MQTYSYVRFSYRDKCINKFSYIFYEKYNSYISYEKQYIFVIIFVKDECETNL